MRALGSDQVGYFMRDLLLWDLLTCLSELFKISLWLIMYFSCHALLPRLFPFHNSLTIQLHISWNIQPYQFKKTHDVLIILQVDKILRKSYGHEKLHWTITKISWKTHLGMSIGLTMKNSSGEGQLGQVSISARIKRESLGFFVTINKRDSEIEINERMWVSVSNSELWKSFGLRKRESTILTEVCCLW